jgi:hypothetical protein
VVGGSAVTAPTVALAVMRIGTPEAVVGALLLAGVLTGAASRSFQSEFVDAWAAGVLGFILSVTLVAFGFGGLAEANNIAGTMYNLGALVYVGLIGFSPVVGLVAAVGGGAGAKRQYVVRECVDGA